MQNKVSVSVIVPVYNAMPYLRQALEGVLDQSFRDFELLLIDDHSSDGSFAVLQEIAGKDARVRVLQTAAGPSGAGAARNVGVDRACGEYLMFLDADDAAKKDLIEKLYRLVSADGADVGICEYETDKGRRFRIRSSEDVLQDGRRVKNLFQIDHANVWNKIFSSKLIKTYSIRFDALGTCNDISFTYSAMSAAKKIKILRQPLIVYRTKSAQQLKASRGGKAANVVEAYASLKKFLVQNGFYDELKASFIRRMAVSILYEAKYCSLVQLKMLLTRLMTFKNRDGRYR